MMWLVFLILIIIIIAVFFPKGKDSIKDLFIDKEKPIEIIKKRYAKGEITKEEFERLKKELEE